MSAEVTWNDAPAPAVKPVSIQEFWVAVLKPLASLQLTVVLFALSLFIIFAGTLAQVDKDIWEVIRIYFRAPIAWIEPHIFFPPSFFSASMRPSFPEWLRIPFPGGWMIGAVMALNLVAAHLVRFQVQARGAKLALGSFVILVGVCMTYLVVQSGANKDGLQQEPMLSYDTTWIAFQSLVGMYLLAFTWMIINGWKSFLGNSRGWISEASVLNPLSLRFELLCILSLKWIALALLFYFMLRSRLSDSSMRIVLELSKGSIAGIVLLIGCALVFGKRAGIVLIHGGVGLMMLGELLVGLGAVEGQMPIEEGHTVNWVQDVRTWELAVIDPSDPREDQVVVVPKGAVLAAGNKKAPLTDSQLPFRMELVEFFPNALIAPLAPTEVAVATKGLGKSAMVTAAPLTSGTDSSGKVDLPAVFMKLTSADGQEDLGTYLFALKFSHEDVLVGDKTYHVSLRFKRNYKPYSLALKDFKKEDYLGTSTPRNFQSDIVLTDPTRNVERDVKIWMNNPLRFAGETFYQSGHDRNRSTGKEVTVLAVVTNTGWLIPYVSCMIVAIGMLAHFMITLSRFLARAETGETASDKTGELVSGTDVVSTDPRRRAARPLAPRAVTHAPLGIAGWFLPLAVVTMAALGVGMQAKTPRAKAGAFDLYRFGQIPIVADGRSKPIDTLARHTMLAISGTQTWQDGNDQRQPAVKWFLDVMAAPKIGADHRVIRIENLEVQELLGLERRKGFRYSLKEISSGLKAFSAEVKKTAEVPGNDQTVYQRKLLELKKKLDVFQNLHFAFAQPQIEGEGQKLAQSVISQMQFQKELKEIHHPALAIPPVNEEESWETYASGWLWNFVKMAITQKPKNPYAEAWEKIFAAYEKQDADAFNAEVAQLHREYRDKTPTEVNLPRVEFEAYFNRVQPMTLAIGLYVTAFVIAALGWLSAAFNWHVGLRLAGRTAFWLTVFTLVIHTVAVCSRMYISGRPPVTNLYSSAVFIGWGCVVLGLLLEAVFRLGLGIVVATVAGYASLLIAWGLESDGSDTFSVMQAVLDTQFWLATHVTCISLGYATTYVAGLFGLLYVLLGVATPKLTPELAKDLTRMNYGTLCFSIFFSFVGTVLGGLWADDSWGRFWGWDPKENGALMIVLWNALALHARWGGMVRERGLAILAIVGNIVVSWSWFGVNALSVGLHAYAFDPRIFMLFCTLTFAHIPLILLGLIPRRLWLSRRGNELTPA